MSTSIVGHGNVIKLEDSQRPMMAESEIKIIDDLLKVYKPKHCLEWGSGNSTIYFPRKHKFIKSWLAIEHNGHYVDFIGGQIPDNANVIWVPEDEWYVDSVKHSRMFNFIFIDGLHRERCLEIAKDIITQSGIILLHDSGRQDYQEFIKKYGGIKLSEGEIPVKEGGYAHRGLTMFKQ